MVMCYHNMLTIKHHVFALFDFCTFLMRCLDISVWLRESWDASNYVGSTSAPGNVSSQLYYDLKSPSKFPSLALYVGK